MTIRVRQVAHVCLLATDIEATRRFYTEALGLETAFNFTRDGRIFGFYLAAGGRTFVEVFEQGDREAPPGRLDHLCLEVEDMDAAIAHLTAQGVTLDRPRKRGCDETWQCWIRDPDGVRIELFQYTAESAQFTGGDRVADW